MGDIGYQGGRVLLPLECYTPGGPNGGNTCGTGSIGVADPATLAFQYYVKLDPAEIPKAMWVEASPDGELLWTSSGPDLLAYRAADVNAANAAPGGPPIHSVRRLAGAVPPSGVTGAAFYRGRLLLAGAQGTTYQIWSVDLATGRAAARARAARRAGRGRGPRADPAARRAAPLPGGAARGVADLRPDAWGCVHFTTGRWAGRGLRVRRARCRRSRACGRR